MTTDTGRDLYSLVLERLQAVGRLEDLPRLLWWVGTVQPEALWRQEELGLEVADALGEALAGSGTVHRLERALDAWLEALRMAWEKFSGSGANLGPRPIWAFWSCYTRQEEKESPLSALLREEVGHPTDAEAGVPVSIREWEDRL